MKFEEKKDHRLGSVNTQHGEITTPTFFPDATYGTVSNVSFGQLDKIGIAHLVMNTMHLEIRLGSDYIKDRGGLHCFTNYNKPILTDSGGFQVYSLINRFNDRGRINEEGATFTDFRTGKLFFLTCESSQLIQHNLNSDIRVVLDEPVSVQDDDKQHVLESVERTTRWALRSKKEFLRLNNLTKEEFDNTDGSTRPLLIAVVQGGNYKDLREKSANDLINIGFDGYGLGGMLTDKNGVFQYDLADFIVKLLSKDKIRYAFGFGHPWDMKTLIKQGWDFFDTVLPTRNGRHGYLYGGFTKEEVVRIKNAKYKTDNRLLREDSKISLLQNTTYQYLHHLFKINDPLSYQIASLYNLELFIRLMAIY